MATTPKGIPYPLPTDPNDIPRDLKALAEYADANPGIANLTTAQRNALSGPQLWVGRTIYNITVGTLETWDGTAWGETGAVLLAATQAARDLAEQYRDQARDISGIDTTDDAVDAVLKLEGGKAKGTLKTTIGHGVEQTQRLMRKLRAGVADASILVIGDSTGDHATEWVYRLAQALADDWPSWTIQYRLANNGADSYDTPVTIQTGTGPRTLTIYNASIPGFHALHFQGARADWAIYPYEPDLIFISIGHNEAQSPTALIHSRYVSLTESVTERLTSDVILIAQNPATGNTFQQTRAQVYREVAATRGFGFIDVQEAFLDTGDAPGLTIDGIHPNAAGSELWAATVYAAFRYLPEVPPRVQSPSTLSSAGEQLLVNGDFVTMPDHARGLLSVGGWWADANTAIEKDTVNYESQRGYGIKLTSAASGLARFGQNVDPKRVRGRWVTAAWRVFIPSGQPQSVGWIAVGDNLTAVTIPGTYSAGAFQWIIATSYISPSATSVNTVLTLDGANGAGRTVTVDRVVLSYGKYPRGSSDSSDRVTVTALEGKASAVSGAGSPAGVVSATAGMLYTRTDAADRVNEAIYPIGDGSSATTGWAAQGGALTNPGGFLRNTLSTTTSTRNILTQNASTQPVVGGRQYTFSAQARTSDAVTVQMLVQFYTAAGAAIGSLVAGAATATNDTTFTTLAGLTATAPADAAYAIVRASIPGANTTTIGGTLDMRRVLIEEASSAGAYFDGSTTGATWNGTPHASSSSMPSAVPALYVKTGSPTVPSTSGWVGVARA